MVGKWYKFIDKSGYYLTKSKWYECKEINKYYVIFLDNEKDIENLNYIPISKFNKWFDTSNPMDYNPDEVKEEKKPQFKVDTITIIISEDGSYQTTSTLEYPEMIKHIKEVAYIGDKQINEA